jgi:hypothetical protein
LHDLSIVIEQAGSERSHMLEIVKISLTDDYAEALRKRSTYLLTWRVHHLFDHPALHPIPQACDIPQRIEGHPISVMAKKFLQLILFVFRQTCHAGDKKKSTCSKRKLRKTLKLQKIIVFHIKFN